MPKRTARPELVRAPLAVRSGRARDVGEDQGHAREDRGDRGARVPAALWKELRRASRDTGTY